MVDSVLLCSWKINFCIPEDALKINFFNALFFNNVQIMILIFHLLLLILFEVDMACEVTYRKDQSKNSLKSELLVCPIFSSRGQQSTTYKTQPPFFSPSSVLPFANQLSS